MLISSELVKPGKVLQAMGKQYLPVNKIKQDKRDVYAFAQANAAYVVPLASTTLSVTSIYEYGPVYEYC